jgi:predicted O-linked N-acetylglucosamine transferase (SPINDLY family)
LDQAISAYRQAIAFDPNVAEVHSNVGSALKDQGLADEALAEYRQAARLDPADARHGSNLVLLLQYHPAYDARAIAEENERWNRQYAQPLAKFIRPQSNDRDPQRRLRVGYVSSDFRDHVVGRNVLPLFAQHDHRQFEITCYAQVSNLDAISRQFQALADSWRCIVGVPDEQLANQIRDDRIDILVDLALHTSGNRLLLFARKPAPLQVTFAGYPGSTGLTAIDYRLSDPYLDPVGMDESVYSERTVRLPDSFWCYDPLDCRNIATAALPALRNGFITFGCLNNFCKVNPAVLALWANVLRQTNNSRLLLLTPPHSPRSRSLEILQRERVDPQRIEFVSNLSRQAYLETYNRIDIGLDTFPYNGHTTSLDSLWMGVPVITLVGDRSVSRAGWSQLSNLDLPDLAAATPEQFAAVAVALAEDLPHLSQLREGLRQRMEQSPLMDAPKFARNIEAAYRAVWKSWCDTDDGPKR